MLFDVAAKLLAHGGEHFFGERVIVAGTEADVKCSGEHVRGNRFFDGGLNGPAALARILHETGVAFEDGIFGKGESGEIEQPGTDDTAATPEFSDFAEIEIEAMIFR